MNLKNCRTILTGATGGIGQHVARQLALQGANLLLVGRQANVLQTLKQELSCHTVIADVSQANGRDIILDRAFAELGGIDLLINNAAISQFCHFASQDTDQIEQLLQANIIAPVLLTRMVLPSMLAQAQGRIVNIGSMFGSLAFAYFSAYSSSKFALRGFSEALRRELDGSGVGVTYIAPRAVKTSANSPAVYRMAQTTKMNMDEPEVIAQFIVQSILRDKNEAYYGWPEKLFARINALFPSIIDSALRQQNQLIAQFAPKS